MTLSDDPIVRKFYLAGLGYPPEPAESSDVGIYGERYTAPPGEGDASTPTPVAAPAPKATLVDSSKSSTTTTSTTITSSTTPASTAAVVAAPTLPGGKLTVGELDMEHAIQEAWESLEPLNVDFIVHLVKTQERDINYPLRETGQTLLMTVAGSVNNAAGEIGEVLCLGGKPFQQDAEGHTAFHWASIHGRASAVEAMARAFTGEGLVLGGKPPRKVVLGAHKALVEGLGIQCKKGRTALATVASTEEALKAKEGELVAAMAAPEVTSKLSSELEAQLQGVRATLASLPATRQALVDAMKGGDGK